LPLAVFLALFMTSTAVVLWKAREGWQREARRLQRELDTLGGAE
jgi:hypothetical protein